MAFENIKEKFSSAGSQLAMCASIIKRSISEFRHDWNAIKEEHQVELKSRPIDIQKDNWHEIQDNPERQLTDQNTLDS